MKRFSWFCWLSALSVAAVVFVAAPAQAQQKLKIALLRTTAELSLIHAEKMAYFPKEGIDVEIVTLNNGPAVVSAVVSGSADIGWAATTPIISAVTRQQPIKAFLTNSLESWPDHSFEHLIASERSGIRTLADLKGKTAASNATNGGCDLTIRDHLRAAGIPADTVKMAVVPFPQMQAALELGTVDAVCIVDPFYTMVMGSPAIKPVRLGDGRFAGLKQIGAFAADAYFAREDWLAANTKAAAGFIRAIAAANADLTASPAKYRALLESEFKMTPELAAKLPIELNTVSLVAEAKDYQPEIDALVRTGLLPATIPAQSVVFTILP